MTARDVIAGIDVEFEHEGEVYAFTIGKENTDAILSVLAAAGYKVLSREPTREMSVEGMKAADGKPGSTTPVWCRLADGNADVRALESAWRAMFDAAQPAKDKP